MSSEEEISLASMPELVQQETGGSFAKRQLDLIRGLKVSAAVSLGEAELTVGKLFELKVGEVVALNKAINEPLELTMDGQVMARGELVVVGDALGLRITEVADR